MRKDALRKRKKLIRSVVLLAAVGGIALAADRIQPLMLKGAAKLPGVEVALPGTLELADGLSNSGLEADSASRRATSSSRVESQARTISTNAPTAPHFIWPVETTKSAEADLPSTNDQAQSAERARDLAQITPVADATPPEVVGGTSVAEIDEEAANKNFKPGPQPSIVAITPKVDDTFGAGFERTHQGAAKVVMTRYNRTIVRPVGDAPLPIVKAALPAARDPGFNLVECIAGCGSAINAVVYYAPRIATQTGLPITAAGVSQVSASAPAGSAASIITCVAGCYSTPKTYVAKRAPAATQHAALAAQPSAVRTISNVVSTSVSYEEPKPVVMEAKVRKQRVRQAARKPMKPLVWRTITHAGAAQLPSRAWRTVVRY
jgi:hypothetical protein